MNKILPLILLIFLTSFFNLTAQTYERVHPTYNSGAIDFCISVLLEKVLPVWVVIYF